MQPNTFTDDHHVSVKRLDTLVAASKTICGRGSGEQWLNFLLKLYDPPPHLLQGTLTVLLPLL